VSQLPDKTRRAFALILTLAVLALPLPSASADAQTRRSRRKTSKPAAASTAPTPVAVPRLAASSSSAPTAVVPSRPQQQQPTPAQTPRPTPAPQATPATDEDAIDEDEVVRVTSNLVVVPVSVTDAGGNAVQGLKVTDFKLEEEGRAQELSAVGAAEEVPLDIALIFDVSSSVHAKGFHEFQQETASRFLREVLKPTDRAAVFTIAEKPKLEQPLASASVATAKVATIPAAVTPTGTAYYDTVSAAAKYLLENAPGAHRRVILVVSDAEDNFSDRIRDSTLAEVERGGNLLTARQKQESLHKRALGEVLREVQRADAVFYSINPTGPGLRHNIISQRAQDGM
jgi:VWFA-related protein